MVNAQNGKVLLKIKVKTLYMTPVLISPIFLGLILSPILWALMMVKEKLNPADSVVEKYSHLPGH